MKSIYRGRRPSALPNHARIGRWRVPRPWCMAGMFIVLVILANALLDANQEIGIRSNVWGVLQQLRACERQSMTPDIVIMGSSRAQAGIAPPILSAQLATRIGRHVIVCDMAVTTSVPLQDLYTLRLLFDDGVRPRMLLYATADFAFNSPIAQGNIPVRDNLEYVARLSDLPNLLSSSLTDPSHGPWNGTAWTLDFVAGRLIRPYADRRGIQMALCQMRPTFGICPDIAQGPPPTTIASTARPGLQYPVMRDLGWYPLPEMTDRSLANSAAQYTDWLAHYQVASDALRSLGQLIGMARTYGSAVVLLNTPILPRHLAFFPHLADYAKYLDALNQFAVAQRVPFYDAGLGIDDDPADFADTNHLNYWGALAFTGWLTDHVIFPEWMHQIR